jgi:hypothetical protein
MFAGKAGARLAKDKRSSLLRKFVNYVQNILTTLAPCGDIKKLFSLSLTI